MRTPTGEAARNPDPVPAHLRHKVAAEEAARTGRHAAPVNAGRDLPLRLLLIQLGVVTTAQLAEAEQALGLAVRQSIEGGEDE